MGLSCLNFWEKTPEPNGWSSPCNTGRSETPRFSTELSSAKHGHQAALWREEICATQVAEICEAGDFPTTRSWVYNQYNIYIYINIYTLYTYIIQLPKMSVALNHPLLVFSRNTNHLNGIPHLFFKPLKITVYPFVVSCILSTFKPLDNWSRHWLPDQASGRRVEADCAGTRSGDCHLQQLKNTRKKGHFQQGKTCSRRFLFSFQSGFQGCRKGKKNFT